MPEKYISGMKVYVAIPSIQVGFFTLAVERIASYGQRGRNPFYSGRFFHSMVYLDAQMVYLEKSQSLLFRSVFSLP